MFNEPRIRPYNLFLDKYQLAEGFSDHFASPTAIHTVLSGVHVDSGDAVELTLVRLDQIPKTERLRFEDESERISRMYHPGLADLLDFGFEGEVAFSVQRKLSGRRVDDFCDPVELDTSIKFCMRLVSALSELHTKDIQHRFFADPYLHFDGNNVGITGLGPQRFVSPIKLEERLALEYARFAAPENISGLVHQAGAASDLYSVGILLFRLLAGKFPFEGVSCNEIFQLQLTNQPDLSLLPRTTPDVLRQLLSKLLHKDPRQRYQTTGSLFAALNEARNIILGPAGCSGLPMIQVEDKSAGRSKSLRKNRFQFVFEQTESGDEQDPVAHIRNLFDDSKFAECVRIGELELDVEDGLKLIEIKTTLAACQYHLGNLKTATLLAKDTYFAAQELDDSALVSRAFLYWSLASLGRLPIEVVERETTKNLTDSFAQSATLLGEAVALLDQDRLDDSQERIREAVRIAEKTNHRQNATIGCCLMATLQRLTYCRNKVYSRIRDKRFARSMVAAANRAIKFAKRNEKWLAFAFRELGAAYAYSGKGREAKAAFLKSINYAKNMNAEYEKVKSYSLMSDFSDVFGWTELEHIFYAAKARKKILERNLMEEAKSSFSVWDRFDMLLHAGRLISASDYRKSIEAVAIDSATRLLRCQKALVIPVDEIDKVVAAENLDSSLIAKALDEEATFAIPSETEINDEYRFGSFMATPIKVANSVDSVLYVSNEAIHGLFGQDDVKIADFLAAATGAAFSKADSIGKLKVLNENLESKVEERTHLIEARSRELEKIATKLSEAKSELEKAKDVAERASEAKSEFLARMSHEIRTPIAAINGFTELMLRGVIKDPVKRKEKLETIYTSGRHLLNLVNEILDLTKVEAEQIKLEAISFNPMSVCHEIMTTLQANAATNNNQLKLKIVGKIPSKVESDPTRFRQVITNILGNAIKFTSNGIVKLELEFIERKMQFLAVRVVDSGIGMTDAQLEKVFDPFAQADTSITRKFGGTGLGLAIAKRLANVMGGDLTATSEYGKGSTFEFTIPFVKDTSDQFVDEKGLEEITSAKKFHKWNGDSLRGRKILVVDDAETNRELLSIMLSEFNVDLICCENGQEAITNVENHREIDIVLMDMMMPVMDGYTATRLIRESGIKTPIIALTANSMTDDENKCIKAGCNDYLAKPLDLDVLLEKLVRHLKPKADASQQSNSRTTTEPDDALANRKRFQKQLEKLSKRFFAKLSDRIGDFQTALNAHDFEAMAHLGHWLKGTAAPFGLKELVQAGKLLDEAGKAKDIVHCIEAIECIVAESEDHDFGHSIE